MSKILYSIVETPRHPRLSQLYTSMEYKEIRLGSIRKANAELKKIVPDVVVAEFIYGYGNNYSGVHISNLDVFLVSLLRYKPDTRIIVMVDKSEFEHVEKLNKIYPITAVLKHPVNESQISEILHNLSE